MEALYPDLQACYQDLINMEFRMSASMMKTLAVIAILIIAALISLVLYDIYTGAGIVRYITCIAASFTNLGSLGAGISTCHKIPV